MATINIVIHLPENLSSISVERLASELETEVTMKLDTRLGRGDLSLTTIDVTITEG